MMLSGAASSTTTANTSGAYTFTGLVSGAYTVTPGHTGYTLARPVRLRRSMELMSLELISLRLRQDTNPTYSISGTMTRQLAAAGQR